MWGFDGLYNGSMTGPTGLFGDGSVASPDSQGFLEVPGGEGKGVPEAIRSFGDIFG
jgi:hypothetical protein